MNANEIKIGPCHSCISYARCRSLIIESIKNSIDNPKHYTYSGVVYRSFIDVLFGDCEIVRGFISSLMRQMSEFGSEYITTGEIVSIILNLEEYGESFEDKKHSM